MIDRTASSLTNSVTVLRTVSMYASMTFSRAVKHARVCVCNDEDLSLLHRRRRRCVASSCGKPDATMEITVVVGRQAHDGIGRHTHAACRMPMGARRAGDMSRCVADGAPLYLYCTREGRQCRPALLALAGAAVATARLHARAGGTTRGEAARRVNSASYLHATLRGDTRARRRPAREGSHQQEQALVVVVVVLARQTQMDQIPHACISPRQAARACVRNPRQLGRLPGFKAQEMALSPVQYVSPGGLSRELSRRY
jgi:hypothetical protein